MSEVTFIHTGSNSSAGVDNDGDGVADSTDNQGYWEDANGDGKLTSEEWHHNMFTIKDWLGKFDKMNEALGVEKQETLTEVVKKW